MRLLTVIIAGRVAFLEANRRVATFTSPQILQD